VATPSVIEQKSAEVILLGEFREGPNQYRFLSKGQENQFSREAQLLDFWLCDSRHRYFVFPL